MRFRTLKKGQSTARKYPERASYNITMTVLERKRQHALNHPNDKNIPSPNKWVFNGKKKKGGKK